MATGDLSFSEVPSALGGAVCARRCRPRLKTACTHAYVDRVHAYALFNRKTRSLSPARQGSARATTQRRKEESVRLCVYTSSLSFPAFSSSLALGSLGRVSREQPMLLFFLVFFFPPFFTHVHVFLSLSFSIYLLARSPTNAVRASNKLRSARRLSRSTNKGFRWTVLALDDGWPVGPACCVAGRRAS